VVARVPTTTFRSEAAIPAQKRRTVNGNDPAPGPYGFTSRPVRVCAGPVQVHVCPAAGLCWACTGSRLGPHGRCAGPTSRVSGIPEAFGGTATATATVTQLQAQCPGRRRAPAKASGLRDRGRCRGRGRAPKRIKPCRIQGGTYSVSVEPGGPVPHFPSAVPCSPSSRPASVGPPLRRWDPEASFPGAS
jgi:hypothetical protein